jgi:MoxR-like ATPase
MQGRNFVLPDDVKWAVLPVLRHRIVLSADLEMDGVDHDRVLSDLLLEVAAPRH